MKVSCHNNNAVLTFLALLPTVLIVGILIAIVVAYFKLKPVVMAVVSDVRAAVAKIKTQVDVMSSQVGAMSYGASGVPASVKLPSNYLVTPTSG